MKAQKREQDILELLGWWSLADFLWVKLWATAEFWAGVTIQSCKSFTELLQYPKEPRSTTTAYGQNLAIDAYFDDHNHFYIVNWLKRYREWDFHYTTHLYKIQILFPKIKFQWEYRHAINLCIFYDCFHDKTR